MEHSNLYTDIAARTGGDIYIGVVGPVRTGKSTLIKRFMELMVLPEIKDPEFRERARDELPQSAAGRTIMTTEPKFVPEQAVTIELENGTVCRTRLIDCVGYMAEGAMGHEENEKPRMVKSPWFEQEVPFDVAAETGTGKVIREHSTIGLAVTTDGSISDIPRAGYEQAEERVINELEKIGKPFVILLNSTEPDAPAAQTLARQLSEKYSRTVLPVSCAELTQEKIAGILSSVLYEFPLREIAFYMPKWVTMLEKDHWLQKAIYDAVREFASGTRVMRDLACSPSMPECPCLKSSRVKKLDPATGCAEAELVLQDDVFYQVLSEAAGLEIHDEASLMPCILELTAIRAQYEKIRSALDEVNATGYGIVMPGVEDLKLEEPEIMHQGGRYGVRLRASAPAINMIRTEISTEVAPIVGTERQSEDLVKSLLENFEEDPAQIWQSNIFGKSLHELVSDGLQNKLVHMPPEARTRLQETIERIINEGCSGLVCIIL